MVTRIRIGEDIIFDDVTYESIRNWVNKVVEDDSENPRVIFAQNALTVMKSRRNGQLFKALQSAHRLIPDGKGITCLATLTGVGISERVTGVELMKNLLKNASKESQRVFLLGARQSVIENVGQKIRSNFPGIDICGVRNGYFDKEEESEILDLINENSPDLLFVGMGTPLQELFLYRNRENIQASVCMGVGGSFDVMCGEVNRAPKFMQNFALEWVYRVYKQPKRLTKVPTILKYIAMVLGYAAKSRAGFCIHKKSNI